MMSLFKRISPFIILLFGLSLGSCLQSAAQPTAKVDTGLEQQLPPYSGPKARAAVARFDWKVGSHGSSTTTIRGAGDQPITITHEHSGIMGGLRDMLTTTLVQSKRFRVVERQELGAIQEEIALGEKGYAEQATAVKKGKIKGADMLVVAAVTGWDPGTSGTGGGIGLGTRGFLGGVLGGVKKSTMAMDIRIFDTATSEVLAETRVEGEATDINLGFLAGGIIGNVGLGGALSTYANTPMEKTIRTCIYEAAKYIIENTPREYFKY
jgi:curli biogenesis system outer membrane secretion channel CsgG